MTVTLKNGKASRTLDEKDVAVVMDRIRTFARTDPVAIAMGPLDLQQVEKTLRRWVTVGYKGTFPNGEVVNGKRFQERTYRTIEELALAVLGQVAAKAGRKHEKELARLTYLNQWISRGLDSALERLYRKLQAQPAWTEGIKPELERISSGQQAHGTYESHFQLTGRLDVLRNPANYPIRRKIIAFHDMSEYLQIKNRNVTLTAGSGTVPHPRPEAYLHSRLTIDQTGGGYSGPVSQVPDETRGKFDLGTRDVNNHGTQACLVAGIPVWAGTSMTTARMLETASWAECTRDELEAVAWSIFAFWQIDYDQRISAVHTLHEVLDVAKNYGVPYDPFFIPALPPHMADTPPMIMSKL